MSQGWSQQTGPQYRTAQANAYWQGQDINQRWNHQQQVPKFWNEQGYQIEQH